MLQGAAINAEEYFIKTMAQSSRAIGDDGALIGSYVYSKDLFFEGVHFNREWMSLYEIARKAMLVNISDAVAMNAVPKYALIGIAMPKSMSLCQMQELTQGLHDAAKQFNIEIIGGDTVANLKLDISVTIISRTDRALERRGLKRGDYLAFTGELGRSAKELRYLLSGGRLHRNAKFTNITLRQRFIAQAAPSLHAGMDISDGLFCDLEKILHKNRLGVRFLAKIPPRIACSGEEYEMLVAFPPNKRRKLQRLAQKNRVALTIFAQSRRGTFTNRCRAHHF